jgi:hypothetical protein
MPRLAAPFLLLALAVPTPAGAQIVGRHDYDDVPPASPFLADSRLPGPGIGRDLRDIRARVDRAYDNGALSDREARRLDREARQIGRLARLYGRDGLSPSERAELQARPGLWGQVRTCPRIGGRAKETKVPVQRVSYNQDSLICGFRVNPRDAARAPSGPPRNPAPCDAAR